MHNSTDSLLLRFLSLTHRHVFLWRRRNKLQIAIQDLYLKVRFADADQYNIDRVYILSYNINVDRPKETQLATVSE